MSGERQLPGLGLYGFWTLGSNGWKDQNDGNLRMLSALVQASVLESVAALPGSPADGDRYLMTAGANEDDIAIRDNGAWVYLTPAAGWSIYDIDAGVYLSFDGSAWAETFSVAGMVDLTGTQTISGKKTFTKRAVFSRGIQNGIAPWNVPARSVLTTGPWVNKTEAAANLWLNSAYAPSLGRVAAIAGTGTGNRVMTSDDGGLTWTIRTSANDYQWYGLCWSDTLSLFVATAISGTGNRVMTSPDGITWTARTTPADNNWISVCWSRELALFVATAITGTGDRVMTSPDGTNWTLRTSPADYEWRGVIWVPELGLFACAATNAGPVGDRIMTSPDGINWTLGVTPADNNWQKIAWSPELGLLVCVAATGTGNRVMTSPDAVTWTARTNPVDNAWRDVVWSPELGLFVAVSSTGTLDRIMTSPDGITWTTRASPSPEGDWQSILWLKDFGRFVVVGSAGTDQVMVSPTVLHPAVDLKANIADPTFTGVPAAPTAAAGTNTTQLATTAYALAAANLKIGKPFEMLIAVSDETTALTTGTAKVTFRMPHKVTLTAVRASVTTAPTGAVLTVDINEAGVSILSTKLTIDATEKTSTTAAAAAVISDASLADDAEMTVDIDTVGSTIAGAGLKVLLIGTYAS